MTPAIAEPAQAAPASEPVAIYHLTPITLAGSYEIEWLNKTGLPDGTKLYAEPAQAEPASIADYASATLRLERCASQIYSAMKARQPQAALGYLIEAEAELKLLHKWIDARGT